MYVAGQPIHYNSSFCLATKSWSDHRTLIIWFLTFFVEKDGLLTPRGEHIRIGFDHELPGYVKNMAFGFQSRQARGLRPPHLGPWF